MLHSPAWSFRRTCTRQSCSSGRGTSAVEVVVINGERLATHKEIRDAWNQRSGRAAPVIVVALAGDQARLCFGAGNEPATYDRSRAQAESLCRAALAEPNREAARHLLSVQGRALDPELGGRRGGSVTTATVRGTEAQCGNPQRPTQSLAVKGAAMKPEFVDNAPDALFKSLVE